MNNYDIIVVGAGPSGLLAAGRAAQLNARVLVLEKMRSEGRKLLITGKGRCNVTNHAPPAEFIKHIYPDGRFLRNAFSGFFSKDIINLLNRYGVELTLERGGRYFPASNKSADILKALLKWVHDFQAEIRCGHQVEALIVEDGKICGAIANGEKFTSNAIILATGGKSYPATGSSGDGYTLAKSVGHTIINPLPALVPLETKGNIARNLQGLNLKNVRAVIWVNSKKTGEAFGEMLFTHFGLSGPIILTLSRIATAAMNKGEKVEITVDLKPALDDQKLDIRLQRDLNEHGKKQLSNIFRNWLPASMIPVFISELNLNPEKMCNQVSSNERKKIRYMMKNLHFEVKGNRPFKEAIITAGGISTREIKPKTMESMLIQGLYFAGELIDADAETGGYNLQIAYSTGWLAGNSAAEKINNK